MSDKTPCPCPAATLLRAILIADREWRDASVAGKSLNELAALADRCEEASDAARHWLREREAEEGEKK